MNAIAKKLALLFRVLTFVVAQQPHLILLLNLSRCQRLDKSDDSTKVTTIKIDASCTVLSE